MIGGEAGRAGMIGTAAMVAIVLGGCITIPPFVERADGGGDPAAPTPRVIRHAYWDGYATGQGSPLMTENGYVIDTTGINPGDLVLFVASLDNGSNHIWRLPAGFTSIAQRLFGSDTQTYVVGWKYVTASEPDVYMDTYDTSGGATTSGAATISLVAITGADPQGPIGVAADTFEATDPVVASSPGITATVDHSLIVMAAGADWTERYGTNTFVPPTDFAVLDELGDRSTGWQWTSQAIAVKAQASKGDTGPLQATLVGKSTDQVTPRFGAAWSVVLTIPPPP